jgi:O-antigen/teichoic acid export membrane protein/polysaccharide pyruvyl transferase WcaK-like protein
MRRRGPVLKGPENGSRSLAQQATLIALTTVGVSIVSYAWSLVLIRLLPVGDYGRFATAQGLLLVLGSGSMAAVPWAVARHISLDRSDRAARQALFFGVAAGVVQGIVFALVAGLVIGEIGGPGLALAAAAAAFTLSMLAAPVGFLQGEQRLRRIAVLRALEAVVRTGAGTLAVVAYSARAVWAVWAFALGSGVAAVTGLASARRGLPLRRGSTTVFRQLALGSLRLGAVQVLLVVLAALDTVVIQFIGVGGAGIADYQVAAVLGRVPFFLSGAVALAYYQPLVRAADDAETTRTLRSAVGGYLSIAVPAVLLLVSVPTRLLALLDPRDTAIVGRLILGTAVSGLALGLVNVVTTAHQARGRFRPALRVLVPAAVLQPIVLVTAGRAGGTAAYAGALAAVAVVIALLVVAAARGWRPWSAVSGRGLAVTGVGAVLVAASLGARSAGVPAAWSPGLWVLAGAVVLPLAARGLRGRRPAPVPAPGGDGDPRAPFDRAVLGTGSTPAAEAPRPDLGVALSRLARPGDRRPVRAVIVGNYGNGNTGDESILAGLLQQLPDAIRPTVLAREPDRVTALHGVPAARTVSRDTVAAFVRCRVLVIGGGGMFGGSLPPLVRVLPFVAIGARLLGKRVCYAAIGAYPDTPAGVQAVLRLSVRLATVVTVRDLATHGVMSTGIARRAVVTVVGDPAEDLLPAPRAATLDLLGTPDGGPAPVVVSLKAMPDADDLAEVCRVVGLALRAEMTRTGVSPVFLCLSAQGDYALGAASSDEVLARRVIDEHLGGRGRIVGPHLDPRLAKAVVGAARCVLAMRLHAQIFATSQQIPVLGLVFEPKARAWLSATGGVAVETDQARPEPIADWLAAAGSTIGDGFPSAAATGSGSAVRVPTRAGAR